MSAGALRAHLSDHHALPHTPLIAMVPVNLRTDSDAEGTADGVVGGHPRVGRLQWPSRSRRNDPAVVEHLHLETCPASRNG
jgi:hypothetical protein